MRYRDRGTQEPSEDHDCPDIEKGNECECAERDADAWEQAQTDAAESHREDDLMGYNDPNDR